VPTGRLHYLLKCSAHDDRTLRERLVACELFHSVIAARRSEDAQTVSTRQCTAAVLHRRRSSAPFRSSPRAL
jgi:hypothetical protein